LHGEFLRQKVIEVGCSVDIFRLRVRRDLGKSLYGTTAQFHPFAANAARPAFCHQRWHGEDACKWRKHWRNFEFVPGNWSAQRMDSTVRPLRIGQSIAPPALPVLEKCVTEICSFALAACSYIHIFV
jgi:hypothetical protein